MAVVVQVNDESGGVGILVRTFVFGRLPTTTPHSTHLTSELVVHRDERVVWGKCTGAALAVHQ